MLCVAAQTKTYVERSRTDEAAAAVAVVVAVWPAFVVCSVRVANIAVVVLVVERCRRRVDGKWEGCDVVGNH